MKRVSSSPLSRARFALSAESRALSALERLSPKSFLRAVELLEARKGKIITTGVGKSGYIAEKIAATLTSLGHQSFFLDPLNALHGDAGMVSSGDVFLALSFSGESAELLKLLRHVKKESRISLLAVTAGKNSSLSKISDEVLLFSVSEEGCPLGLAPMASTTASLVIGDMLAAALTSPESFEKKHFAAFHPAGSLGLSLRKVSEAMVSGAKLPVVSEKDTFAQALEEISKKRFGVTAVVDKRGVLVGVLTDGDIRRILLKHDQPKKLLVREVMTPRPKWLSADASLKEALSLMEKHKITSLFVAGEKGKLSGLVHIHTILGDAQ